MDDQKPLQENGQTQQSSGHDVDDLARLQELHAEILTMKKARKELKDIFKDALSHHERYQEILEESKKSRVEKKAIEVQIKEEAPGDVQKLEELDTEIQSSEELLSDLAFNLLLKNESVEVMDQYKNRYIPKFTVKFQKEDAEDQRKED